MAVRHQSKHKVRSSPLIHIPSEDKERIDRLAIELDVLNFEALRIVLFAGFEAIDSRLANPTRIKEELKR